MSRGTKCGRIGCEVRTEGMVIGRIRSLSSRSGQAFCWLRIAEIPLQGLTSAVALVSCIHTGVSELIAHDEWRGSSFASGKAFSASRKCGGMAAAGTFAVRLLYHERLPSATLRWVETGGTNQSGPGTEGVRLRQSRHHCGRDRRSLCE